jgi:ribosome-binding protein aMBF1 (putative translation factor)
MPYSRDESKYLKQVGKAIRELRGRSGMSQEDLAAKTGLH